MNKNISLSNIDISLNNSPRHQCATGMLSAQICMRIKRVRAITRPIKSQHF